MTLSYMLPTQVKNSPASIANLELAWVCSKQAPTLFLTDLLKILNTRLDSVSKIPTTTAVTTATMSTVSVKKTQYIHTETTNTKHKIYPLHTRLSQRVKYSVNLFTQLNYYGITKH